jgi:hypothetical protein
VAGSPDLLEAMASCLNTQSRLHQLSLEWTPQLLLGLKEFGLPLSDFIVALDDNRVTGCAALWDQRSFRQTVVRGYSGRIALAKPWLQLGAFLFNGPRLPAVGSTLAHAFLSPLAADPNRPNLMSLLLNRSLVEARKREIEFLTIGFAANDPRLSTVEGSRRSRRYLSRLYQVSWPGEHDEPQLDGRLLGPEVALL